ncbi:MAG: HEAT repeat domain-containing protein [Planctomycetes bacterium]|nr:HEAT repeat domain-containing protein [Planctomycetota bacterium]
MTIDGASERWRGRWAAVCVAGWVLLWTHIMTPAQDMVENPNKIARVLFDTRWDRHAFQDLLTVLRNKSSNDDVRAIVTHLLEAGRYPPEVDSVIDALQDNDWRIRAAAAKILSKLMSEIRTELREEVLPPTLEAVKDDFSEEVREKIEQQWYDLLRKMTAEIEKKAPPVLIEALRDSHTAVKVQAASALGEIGSASAIRPLVEALKEGNPELRRTAAIALGGVGDKTAVPALIRMLKDTREDIQTAAAQGLVGIGHDAIPALIGTLNEDNWRSRERAAGLLSLIGDHTALDGLAKAMQDDNWRTRTASARLLGEISRRLIWDRYDDDAIPQLLEMATPKLSDLAELDTERKVDIKKRNKALDDLRKTGEKIGGPVFLSLLSALGDPAWEVRATAAESLGQIGAREPIPGIVLALKHENVELRTIAEQIRKVRETIKLEAATALNGVLKDRDPRGEVRVQAALALGAIGHYSSMPILVNALTDSDSRVRDAAQRALNQIKSE